MEQAGNVIEAGEGAVANDGAAEAERLPDGHTPRVDRAICRTERVTEAMGLLLHQRR